MADRLVYFLNFFGLSRERDELRRRVDAALDAAAASGGLTRATYLREFGLGTDEFDRGQLQAAYERFGALKARMEALPEDAPLGRRSYEYCLTLVWLSRSLEAGGQPVFAEAHLRAALGVIDALIAAQPPLSAVREGAPRSGGGEGYLRQRGALLTGLGDVLAAQGKFEPARAAYEESLLVKEEIGEERGKGVALIQLGTLALRQRDYADAARRYREALALFQALGESASEAVAWHQLGMVAEEQQQWAEAERCYRASLEIEERLGHAVGAAQTCNQLAIVARRSGRPAEAEGWYMRALAIDEQFGNDKDIAIDLNNLAFLLLDEVRAGRAPATRLAEARGHAERALAIREMLDTSAEIWTTLSILAGIADLEGNAAQARDYRRRERIAFAAFAGNRWHIDNQFGELIAAIVAAAGGDAGARAQVEGRLPGLEQAGWKIGDAVRRVWAGERDWHALCEGLDSQDALLVLRVLEALGGDKLTS
jgi:tetratricopeptide (TPR) repeat protein